MFKLASWNVNGLRACAKKNFVSWSLTNKYDLLCLQEIKALPEQLPDDVLNLKGYESFFAPAEKKGYSGVAIYRKKSSEKPIDVQIGIGKPEFDSEGRTIWMEFKDFFVFNCYFPNGQRDHGRVPYKLSYSDALTKFALKKAKAKKKELIICGDYNTAHQEIDLKNYKTNHKTTGFLPIEREWLDKFIKKGFIDIFREKHKDEKGHYTWWSYRGDCRSRNIGWRIDYFFITKQLLKKCKKTYISPETLGSDHCPIILELS